MKMKNPKTKRASKSYERFIATSLGAARLFTLGYGYSSFAWNSLLSGLGKLEENSDSYRIAACAQLLGAGQRLKVFLHGGGDEKQTSGFAGKYLSQRSWTERSEWKKTGPENWKGWIKALEDQTSVAGPRAAAILKRTNEHLLADSSDMSSEEVAKLIWPEK